MAAQGRIRAFDWLKGIAVLVIVQTHTLALLRTDLRGTPLHHRLSWIDGLVAPSFILTSGFALPLVQVRGAALGREGRGPRARKSLRHIAEVLLVASLMTWIWFPVVQEPGWLLRIDILQCIGLSLAVALPLFASLSGRPSVLAAVSAVVGVAILAATPLAYTVRSGLAARFLSDGAGPLFPWGGYVFLGGALGAVAARGEAGRLAAGTAALGALGGGLWLCAAPLVARWPNLKVWLMANHGQRLVVVSALVLLLLAAERWLPVALRRSRAARLVELLGTSSLSAYFGHEVMLFVGVRGVGLDALFDRRADWPMYWLLTAGLIALTALFTFSLTLVDDWLGRSLPGAAQRLRARSRWVARAAVSHESRPWTR